MDEIIEKLDLLRKTDEKAFHSALREMGIPDEIISSFKNESSDKPSPSVDNVSDLLAMLRTSKNADANDEVNKSLNLSGKKIPEVLECELKQYGMQPHLQCS